jgi:hypothetical protein
MRGCMVVIVVALTPPNQAVLTAEEADEAAVEMAVTPAGGYGGTAKRGWLRRAGLTELEPLGWVPPD